jgi:hypothetical protein
MLSPIPLAAWTFSWVLMAHPSDGWRRTIAIIVGGMVGAAVFLGAAELWHGQVAAQPADNQHGETMTRAIGQPGASGNFNLSQQGGNNYQTYINQVPEKLKLTDSLRAKLLAKLPRDKTITVQAVGSQSDQMVGKQISDFLAANGYRVVLNRIGVISPPPNSAIAWNANGAELTVAPSVR